ncbi:MAG: hypothetical protein K2J93_00675 [Anaeroplasmataceae bacterium]|nr:hypothetical protein [Anaeroplasmataceae bacterium]
MEKNNLEKENSILYFTESDGWLFYTLYGLKKLKLYHLISSGDYLMRAIFTLEEINQGLSRLVSEEFLEIKEKRLIWKPKSKQLIKANTKFFGYPIDEMLRFVKIFREMPLSKEPMYINYISEYDYQTTIHKYTKQ